MARYSRLRLTPEQVRPLLAALWADALVDGGARSAQEVFLTGVEALPHNAELLAVQLADEVVAQVADDDDDQIDPELIHAAIYADPGSDGTAGTIIVPAEVYNWVATECDVPLYLGDLEEHCRHVVEDRIADLQAILTPSHR